MVASARRPQTKSLIRHSKEAKKQAFNRHSTSFAGHSDIASTARNSTREPADAARAEMLRDVPHRVQLPGSGCGLYSLRMVMNYSFTGTPSINDLAHPLPT